MKRLGILFSFVLVALFFAAVRPSTVSAQCTGATTGLSGTCEALRMNCRFPKFYDGKSSCTGANLCCVVDPTGTILPPNKPFCNTSQTGGGINTAIGCIPYTSNEELVGFLFKWGIGIAGGIAFLLIIYAGFIITTSKGSPDRLKGGQELLTAALSGLILLIFSIFILEIIGVRILNIPGFGK